MLIALRTGRKPAYKNQIIFFSDGKISTRIKRQTARTQDSCVPTLKMSPLLQQPTLTEGQPNGSLVKGNVCLLAHQIATFYIISCGAWLRERSIDSLITSCIPLCQVLGFNDWYWQGGRHPHLQEVPVSDWGCCGGHWGFHQINSYKLFLKFSLKCIHPYYVFYCFTCFHTICPNLSSAPCILNFGVKGSISLKSAKSKPQQGEVWYNTSRYLGDS